MNKRQQELRAQGLCLCCGAEPRGVNRNTGLPYTLCEPCHQRNLETTKARQARLKSQGHCQKCGTKDVPINPETKQPFQYCQRCNTKSRRGMYERRERYRAEGRCRVCGDSVENGSPISCRKCMDKRNLNRRKKIERTHNMIDRETLLSTTNADERFFILHQQKTKSDTNEAWCRYSRAEDDNASAKEIGKLHSKYTAAMRLDNEAWKVLEKHLSLTQRRIILDCGKITPNRTPFAPPPV